MLSLFSLGCISEISSLLQMLLQARQRQAAAISQIHEQRQPLQHSSSRFRPRRCIRNGKFLSDSGKHPIIPTPTRFLARVPPDPNPIFSQGRLAG